MPLLRLGQEFFVPLDPFLDAVHDPGVLVQGVDPGLGGDVDLEDGVVPDQGRVHFDHLLAGELLLLQEAGAKDFSFEMVHEDVDVLLEDVLPEAEPFKEVTVFIDQLFEGEDHGRHGGQLLLEGPGL